MDVNIDDSYLVLLFFLSKFVDSHIVWCCTSSSS
jgi:hypothetical protein